MQSAFRCVTHNAGSAPPVYLFVATKTDLPQREVGKEYGQELGARHGVMHKEISATGDLSALEELVTDVAAQVQTFFGFNREHQPF